MQKSFVAIIQLFILLISASFVEATPPLRKAGIGYRYGFIEKSVIFSSQYGSSERDISPSTGEIEGVNSYVYTDTAVSEATYTRSPVAIQFPENPAGGNSDIFAVHSFIIDYSGFEFKDLPPKLIDGLNYIDLINANYLSILSDDTNLSKFKEEFPEYQGVIDSLVEPSLSADYKSESLSLGWQFNLFFPFWTNNRIAQFGFGFGFALLNGSYTIKLCDPYIISAESKKNVRGYNFREVICSNETELYTHSFLRLVPFSLIHLKGYSYIGDNLEINFLEFDVLTPGADITNFDFHGVNLGSEDKKMKTTLWNSEYNLFSVILTW